MSLHLLCDCCTSSRLLFCHFRRRLQFIIVSRPSWGCRLKPADPDTVIALMPKWNSKSPRSYHSSHQILALGTIRFCACVEACVGPIRVHCRPSLHPLSQLTFQLQRTVAMVTVTVRFWDSQSLSVIQSNLSPSWFFLFLCEEKSPHLPATERLSREETLLGFWASMKSTQHVTKQNWAMNFCCATPAVWILVLDTTLVMFMTRLFLLHLNAEHTLE